MRGTLAAVVAVPIACALGGGRRAAEKDARTWRRDTAIVHAASGPYGNGQTTPTEPQASVGPASATPAPAARHSNGLPFTGGDVLGLTFIGIGLVLMGTALPGRPRRGRDVPVDS
jgi:hypothetical protein